MDQTSIPQYVFTILGDQFKQLTDCYHYKQILVSLSLACKPFNEIYKQIKFDSFFEFKCLKNQKETKVMCLFNRPSCINCKQNKTEKCVKCTCVNCQYSANVTGSWPFSNGLCYDCGGRRDHDLFLNRLWCDITESIFNEEPYDYNPDYCFKTLQEHSKESICTIIISNDKELKQQLSVARKPAFCKFTKQKPIASKKNQKQFIQPKYVNKRRNHMIFQPRR